MFCFSPFQKFVFAFFAFFMTGMLVGVAAFNMDIEGPTTKTMIFGFSALLALILTIMYTITVFKTVVIEDVIEYIKKEENIGCEGGFIIKE